MFLDISGITLKSSYTKYLLREENIHTQGTGLRHLYLGICYFCHWIKLKIMSTNNSTKVLNKISETSFPPKGFEESL